MWLEVEYIGERRTSIVRSKMGRGELCADEGKRRVVHHEWRLDRGGGSFFEGSTLGYIADGAVFARRVHRGWEYSVGIMVRKGIYEAGAE